MNYREIEDSVPLKIYEKHNAVFNQLQTWLEEQYSGYANRGKIIKLLSYWLYINKTFFECYSRDGLEKFSKSKSGNPFRYSYEYEYEVDVNLVLKTKPNKILFKLVSLILLKAYLPGGNVIPLLAKVGWRLTKHLLNIAPIELDLKKRDEIIDKLIFYFKEMGISDDQKFIAALLKNSLPEIFYSKKLTLVKSGQISLDCSASAFMEFCGYEKILLFNNPIFVIGRQHGGGYDTFKEDYFIMFEKDLCDKFLGWGLSNENDQQYRYPKIKKSLDAKKIIWVERARLTFLSRVIFPDIYKQWTNQKVIPYIGNELKKSAIGYYSLMYPGKLRSTEYNEWRGFEFLGKKGKGESLITTNDIVIFDNVSASLVHHCVENDIAFILVLERGAEIRFTDLMKEWFLTLRKEKMAFFTDEVGLLQSRVTELFNNEFALPLEIVEYHNKKFKNFK